MCKCYNQEFGFNICTFLPATSQFRIFCLPVCHPKIKRLKQSQYFVILCGCETWSVTQRKEHSSRMFENMALRKICGHKRDEVMGLEDITQ
jgi:hypothetical protein